MVDANTPAGALVGLCGCDDRNVLPPTPPLPSTLVVPAAMGKGDGVAAPVTGTAGPCLSGWPNPASSSGWRDTKRRRPTEELTKRG